MNNRYFSTKHTVGIATFFFLFMTICFFTVFYFYHQKQVATSNQVLSGILVKLEEKYPELTKEEIIEVLNGNGNFSFDLSEFGIDIQKDAFILQEEDNFSFYVKVFFSVSSCLLVLYFFLLFFFYSRYQKNMRKLISYMESLQQKNYDLKIQENKEGVYSILKNEIYKTTVMLQEMAEESKQDKWRLKNSLSDISHQLKTPLTSISILLDNLLEGREMSEKKRLEFLRFIKRDIFHIQELVQSILTLSRFDADAITFSKSTTSVNDLLAQAIEKVSTLADLKSITISIIGSKDAIINCDVTWQIEAISNILKNCLEHSLEDSEIYVSYDDNPCFLKITIQDFGCGISKEELPHIFDRFYQGRNTSKEGVGIGLALAKSIIEHDQGIIRVTSEINHGTTFTILYFYE